LLAPERRNVALLSTCQALLLVCNATVVSLNGLAGYALATDKSYATLPVTAWVVGAAMAAFPASLLMKRIGRRGGFTLGAVVGIIGALISAMALSLGHFALLCVGTLCLGMYNGVSQFYRFAAADAVRPDVKAKAISLVLAGGLVGGLIGPETSKLTVDFFATPYVGAYLFVTLSMVLAILALQVLRIPPPSEAERKGPSRPLREIMAQPKFVVAVICSAVGYGVMNLLMTATPLAMAVCGYAYAATASVIGWHIIGMYAPSLFTGSLIRKFGIAQVMMAGVLLLYICVAIALAGNSVSHFWWAMVIQGVGWNFLYVSGTTLVTESYQPAEKAKAQGANDVAIFLTMVVSSFSSGMLLENNGWQTLNYLALPLVTVAAGAILWLFWLRRPAVAGAS
jgi:MFS family permease